MRARAEPWKAGAVGPQPRHLLSGLARCGESGGPIAAVAAKSPPATRACSRRRFKRDLPGLAWSERSRPSWSYAKGLDSPVKALVANGAEILAGDDWGKLVQSLDEGRTFAEWELPSTPYGPKQAIAVWKDRRLVVRGAILFPPMRVEPGRIDPRGEDSFRVLHSQDGGKTWRLVSQKMENGPTSALVAGSGGCYLGLASDGLWFLPTAVPKGNRTLVQIAEWNSGRDDGLGCVTGRAVARGDAAGSDTR
jgi:hypothetical protein